MIACMWCAGQQRTRGGHVSALHQGLHDDGRTRGRRAAPQGGRPDTDTKHSHFQQVVFNPTRLVCWHLCVLDSMSVCMQGFVCNTTCLHVSVLSVCLATVSHLLRNPAGRPDCRIHVACCAWSHAISVRQSRLLMARMKGRPCTTGN
jgi:hypothetical protein